MKIKKLISLLLVAVLVLPVLSACGGAADDTVVIGYIGDLSGNDAYVGTILMKSLKMAALWE